MKLGLNSSAGPLFENWLIAKIILDSFSSCFLLLLELKKSFQVFLLGIGSLLGYQNCQCICVHEDIYIFIKAY